MKNQLLTIATAISFTAIILAGCVPVGSNPEDPCPSLTPPITRILGITVTPDTLVEGDTATVTIVVEDSLLDGLKYSWPDEPPTNCSAEWLGATIDQNGRCVTTTNTVKWIVPEVNADSTIYRSVWVRHDSLETDVREHNDERGCWYGSFEPDADGFYIYLMDKLNI